MRLFYDGGSLSDDRHCCNIWHLPELVRTAHHTARAGVGSALNALFKAFPQIQHLVTASLEAAIFSVPGLGVDDLAAVFTLDSAHAGVTINEIFHQGVLIFTFPLFCCHRHPPLAVTGVWWIMKSIICQKCYGSVAVIKMVTATFAQ